MKLIDKAKLMNHIKGFLGIKSPSRVFMEKLDIEWDDVENASTVEAIPIEYLENWSDTTENGWVWSDTGYQVIHAIIEDWRKENED